jgi:hypothetical protein
MVELKKLIHDLIPFYPFIKHVMDKTDTNIFHPDAREILFDEERLRELEKYLASRKSDVIFKYNKK